MFAVNVHQDRRLLVNVCSHLQQVHFLFLINYYNELKFLFQLCVTWRIEADCLVFQIFCITVG